MKRKTQMKKKLLAAAAMAAALSTPAHAMIQLACGPGGTLIGVRDNRPAPPYRVVGTTVVHGPNGLQIDHHLANGGVASRTGQYTMIDTANANQTQWTGDPDDGWRNPTQQRDWTDGLS